MPRRVGIVKAGRPKAGSSLGITNFDFDSLRDPGIILLKVTCYLQSINQSICNVDVNACCLYSLVGEERLMNAFSHCLEI